MKHLFKITLLSIALILCFVNTSFGAITFTYDESDNKVVQTEGTEGTPADFDDFVTADRAGTAELTPEDAPVAFTQASSISLTYAVRPVEDLALTLTFTISGSAGLGAGDTIDLSGDDWEGNNQTESIVIAGGDAAYPSTKKYSTIDANGITFTDNAGGGFSGDLKVTQPQWGVIWDFGNGQYRLDCIFDIGNSGTSTYFASYRNQVFINGNYAITVTTDATWTDGTLRDETKKTVSDSSVYRWAGTAWHNADHVTINGTALLYGTYCLINIAGNADATAGYFRVSSSTTKLVRCMLQNFGRIVLSNTYSPTLRDLLYAAPYANHSGMLQLETSIGTPTIDEFKASGLQRAIYTYGSISPAMTGGSCDNCANDIVTWDYTGTLSITDATGVDFTSISWGGTPGAGKIQEIYTCNIHVTDKDGGAIANTATVACTRADVVTESAKFYKCTTAHTSGTFATDLAAGKWEEITDATILDAAPAWLTTTDYVSAEAEFSVNPTSGAIAEQTLTYKVWTGPSELETKYLHTFTISETGYKTLIMEDREIDAPMGCTYELQSITMPPAPFFGDLAPDDYYFAEVVNE